MFPLYVIFVSGTLGSAHYGSDLFWTIAFGLSRKNLVHGISRVLLEISSIFSSFLALKCNRCMEVVGTQTGRQTDEMFRKAGRERVLSHSRGLHTATHCSTLLHTAPHTALICISLKNTFFFTSKVSVQKKLQDFSKLSVDPNQRLELFWTSLHWQPPASHGDTMHCSVVDEEVSYTLCSAPWYALAPWCTVMHHSGPLWYDGAVFSTRGRGLMVAPHLVLFSPLCQVALAPSHQLHQHKNHRSDQVWQGRKAFR